MRVILDTNILISAVLFASSTPGKAFDKVLDRHTLLASEESCAELGDVIWRKKLDPYSTPEERHAFLNAFINHAKIVETTERIAVCRDLRCSH